MAAPNLGNMCLRREVNFFKILVSFVRVESCYAYKMNRATNEVMFILESLGRDLLSLICSQKTFKMDHVKFLDEKINRVKL